MPSADAHNDINFLDGRKSRFSFRCQACGRCCGEYLIVLTPYDILRLRKATKSTTSELIKRGVVRLSRMPFKRVFGFEPVADLFDAFGISQTPPVPVALMGFRIDSSGTTRCEFLGEARDGKRLCSIYEDRPTMCRLHPLGCTTVGTKRMWFFRRPLCDSTDESEQTVEEWLRASRAQSHLSANAQYLRWMRELLEDPRRLPAITESQWRALEQILYDFDAGKSDRARITIDTIERTFYRWLSETKL